MDCQMCYTIGLGAGAIAGLLLGFLIRKRLELKQKLGEGEK